jgi:hypothetical protein
MIKAKLLCTSLLLVLISIVGAQAPQGFNYQAVVRDNNGNPLVNQQVEMRFTIHDGGPNGPADFVQGDTITTNAFGIITVVIGGGAIIQGNFANIPWATGNKFLQVELDATGSGNYNDLGTLELLSVPYALYAANAPTGLKGDTGPQGNTGATGAQGATGPIGATGANGNNGAQGATGPIGPQGATGANGNNGLQGVTGPAGPQGNAGPAGATGPAGPQGATGANGNDGLPGSTGPIGPQGSTGPQGATGVNGNDGLPGATGPVGPQGSTGPQGVTGANGNDGLPGATGPIGPQGNTGPQGATGANGNDGLPGATGAIGPQGNTGPQGATGANGNDGLPGTTGPIGPQGNTGPQGATGANGNDGLPGATGPIGPQGITGAQGITGPQGATGANGNDGQPGSTGATGPQGSTGPAGISTVGATGPQGATGATGMLPNGTALGNTIYWDGSQWKLNSGFIYNDGQNIYMGQGTDADNHSIAIGNNSVASALQTNSIGTSTIANGAYETVVGSYNDTAQGQNMFGWSGSDRIFEVGNGSGPTSRSNALTVLKNGNVGVGFTNPQNALEVHGSTYVSDSLGVGTSTPHTKLDVTGGDLYLNGPTSGIILKSVLGVCVKLTVSNAGLPVLTIITCP